MTAWKLLKFLSHATGTRIPICTARNRLRGVRLIFELWNLNFNIDHFVKYWWRKWVYFQKVLLKMFTFVRRYMNFIVSKFFVNINTVLRNYCTQCLYWLNFFFWVYYPFQLPGTLKWYILCPCRQQLTRDDHAVRVQWFSSAAFDMNEFLLLCWGHVWFTHHVLEWLHTVM